MLILLNWDVSSLEPFLWRGRFRFLSENGRAARSAWALPVLQQTLWGGPTLNLFRIWGSCGLKPWLDDEVQAIYVRRRDFNHDSLYKILIWIIKSYLGKIFLVSDLTSKASKQGGTCCPLWSVLAWVCYEFVDKVSPLLIFKGSIERRDQLPGQCRGLAPAGS